MLFFGLIGIFQSIFTSNNDNINKPFSPVNWERKTFSENSFCVQICVINFYLLLNIVPRLAQPVPEKVAEFGNTKPISLRMGNDFKSFFCFDFLQPTLLCFQMWLWVCPSMFIKWSVKFGGDEALFRCEFAEERNFQKVSGFRQYVTNVRMFVIILFGLGHEFVKIIYSSLGMETTFSWTRGLACRTYLADLIIFVHLCPLHFYLYVFKQLSELSRG